MARQNSLITFTGKLGNLIGYCRNGEYFLRGMPEIVRQTVATRKAAQRFGAASRRGALIRSAIMTELDIHCDTSYINRLTRALIPTTGNRKRTIEGYRFNQETGTDRFFPVAPVFSADGTLEIPAQTLPRLKGITALEVKVIASRINFTTHRVMETQVETTTLNLREPFSGMTLPIKVQGTETHIVTLQIRCIHDGYPSNDRKYQAADIIAVLVPQIQRIVKEPVRHQETRIRSRKTAVSDAVSDIVYAYIAVPVTLRE